MDRKKDIIRILESISGRYSMYEVFSDWIRCGALAISNACQYFHDRIWKEREQEYINTMKKYKPEEQNRVEMLCLLTETLENEMEDVLGQIYMDAGMGSRSAGQFFTPWHLSLLCADVAMPDPDENGCYRINEPSCGGGGMIIAAACAIRNRGLNYQKCMKVVAQDLDWKGVYMCYLQLSLLGIRAVVVQGDALQEPYEQRYPRNRTMYTPGERGLLIWWNFLKEVQRGGK